MKYALHGDGVIYGIGKAPWRAYLAYKLNVFPRLDNMPKLRDVPVDGRLEDVKDRMAINKCSEELYSAYKRSGRDLPWTWDEDNVMIVAR